MGGVEVVLKKLLDGGYIHGDCIAVTGKTRAENLEGVSLPEGQDVVYPVKTPIHPTGGLVDLRGDALCDGGISRATFKPRSTNYNSRVLEKCAKLIGPLRNGAVTHSGASEETYVFVDF